MSAKLISTNRRWSYLLSSTQKISGTNGNQLTYYIDWDTLPDGKYHLHFTYLGQANTLNAVSGAYITLDGLGASTNTQLVSSTGAVNQTFLGVLKQDTFKGTISILYADDQVNEVIFLNNKPSSSQVTVSIWKATNPPTLFLDDAGVPQPPAPYQLALHFELLE